MFIGVFALLYSAMPSDFFEHQAEYDLLYQEQKQIAEEFEALDLTLYDYYGNDSMVYQYSSIEDHPSAPQYQSTVSGRFIEVWWGDDPSRAIPALQIRDTQEGNFLGIVYYYALEYLTLTVEGETLPSSWYFTRPWLTSSGYEDYYNLTITARGEFVSVNMILKGNETETIGDSWDLGQMEYSINYEIDFEAMKPSAWTLIGQLLTFQNPDFGLPGLFGEILTYALALVIWASIILLTYTIITKLIPTIQGGVED